MKVAKILTIIGGVCLALMFTAESFVAAQKKPIPTGELRIGVPTLHMETFHPLWTTNFRKGYLEPMFDHLVGVDGEGKFLPEESIAYKWEEATDRMSWTFYIRDGVKFHDGTALTIDDVKYSIEETTKLTNMAARSEYMNNIDKVETVPPNKVVVHLKKPWPVILHHFSPLNSTEGMIIPKKYIEAKGKAFEREPIGTGPYKLFEQKEGDYIKLVAQDSHWRVGVPKYKYITFKIIPEEGTREAALRTGEVDLAKVSLTRANKLETDGFTIHKNLGSIEPLLTMIRIYDPNNPLSKKKVRQALVYAIDKASILKHIMKSHGEVIGHHFAMTKWSIGYKKTYPLTPYDPQKAKQLLTEAGYPDGFTIYLYSYITDLPEAKLINEAIAGYWKAIGLKPIILEMEYEAFKPVWARKKDPPGPSVNLHPWTSRPVYPWFGLYHTKGGWSNLADPQLDQLIEDFNKQVTIERYGKAAQIIMDYVVGNYYHTGLFSTHEFWASSPKVPKWELGRNTYGSCRLEYIGRTK